MTRARMHAPLSATSAGNGRTAKKLGDFPLADHTPRRALG